MAAPGWVTIKIDTNAGPIAAKIEKIADHFYSDVLYGGVKELADDGKKMLELSVHTWTNRPEIRVRPSGVSRQTAKVEIEVVPALPFAYVDLGTPGHWIPVGHKGFLAFREGYLAKTIAGVFGSQRGGASGPWVFVRRPIWVKGIKPRHFLKMTAQLIQKNAVTRIGALIRKALRW